MFCSKCGKTIADDSVFCQHCGATMDAAAAPSPSAPAAQPASPTPAAPKTSRMLLIVLVIALAVFLGFAISHITSDEKDADAPAQTQAASDTAESSDIPKVEVPDVDLPDIAPVSDGSMHSKVFKRSSDRGSIRYAIVYSEGTYDGAPDDTILGFTCYVELNRTVDGADEMASDLYQLGASTQELNNPNFSFRDNTTEYYSFLTFEYSRLHSAESAELLPSAAMLLGISPSGNVLKMSQVESFLTSNGFIVSNQD